MPAPGTKIRERSAPADRTLPVNTGQVFVAGTADRGDHTKAIRTRSISEFERFFGTRQSYSSLWDVVDNLFREGANDVWVARRVGPAPTVGTLNLLDNVAAVSLVVTPKSVGAWSVTLRVIVLTSVDDATIPVGQFQLRVSDTVLGTLETSPILTSQQDAINWATTSSDYIKVSLGASALVPVRVASPGTAFSASTDDRANETDATALTALNLFTKDLGPGQVLYVNRVTTVAYGQLLDHAAANNRFALLDAPDTAVKATLLSSAQSVRTHVNARYGAMLAPWIQVPALTVGGAVRDLQPSAMVAGIIARNEQMGISPNQAPAGDLGDSNTAVAVKASFPVEQDRADLNDGSISLIVQKFGSVIRTYGFRTMVSKVTNPNWWQAANARLYMAIAAKADSILEGYVEKKIDGKGLLFAQLRAELTKMLNDYYLDGSLYGPTAEGAFFVDVSDSVNTPATIANGEIHAVLEITMSPTGEQVILDIVKKTITG